MNIPIPKFTVVAPEDIDPNNELHEIVFDLKNNRIEFVFYDFGEEQKRIVWQIVGRQMKSKRTT